MKQLTIILLAGVLAACIAIPVPVEMTSAFNLELHKPFAEAGTSTIRGQGFLRQRGGSVVTCAGSPVYVLPGTEFFREAVAHMVAGRSPIISAKAGPEYRTMFKQGQCDAQGNFEFLGVAAGPWIVITEVHWTVGYSDEGGNLMREIDVQPGASVQVLLSDNDRA